MTENSKRVVRHIKKRKNDLTKVLGGSCCICGFNAFQEALEFHHVDPSTKEFAISNSGNITKALEKQLDELRKCALLCSNCHKGVHAGHLTVPDNWTTLYDENVAQELIDEKHHQDTVCRLCGKVISAGATHCAECNSLLQRQTERPSRDELKAMIRTLPFTQIAQQFGISDNGIRKWCDAYNLPRKKSDIKAYSDEEWATI